MLDTNIKADDALAKLELTDLTIEAKSPPTNTE